VVVVVNLTETQVLTVVLVVVVVQAAQAELHLLEQVQDLRVMQMPVVMVGQVETNQVVAAVAQVLLVQMLLLQ
jgi:hypothetical protein